MRVFSLIFSIAYLVSVFADKMDEEGFKNLKNYVDSLPEQEQGELIQMFVDTIVDNLVKEDKKEKLAELYGALEKVTHMKEEPETGISKRDASEDAYLENLKRGHCCLGGDLIVSYATKSVTIPVVQGVYKNTQADHKSCGLWGWKRCAQTTSTNNIVAYTTERVDLRVPRFSCHQDRAVCCHGYVEIKKLPGSLAELGEGNCIKSNQALFTIWNLQLLERVNQGTIKLTESQQDRVLETIQKFFDTNGVQPGSQ